MYKIPDRSLLMNDFIFSKVEFYFYHTNLDMSSSIAPWLLILGQVNSNSMVWLLCVELKKGELIKAPFVSFIQIIVL